MKLHKGNISFTSNEGEGSTFLLTFRKGNRHLARYILSGKTSPLSTFLSDISTEDNSSELSPEVNTDREAGTVQHTDRYDENEPNQTAHTAKERILIVEDNDDLRFYLKKTFASIYTVIDKPDGESALEYLQDKSVDLIISDVMMICILF